MGLYDNAWPTTYEEIRRFYPVWYQDVLEMDAIWRAAGQGLDHVRATIELILSNSFVVTADEPTVTELEKFLNISYQSNLTLEQRRQVILGYLFGYQHIGAPEIRDIIAQYTDRAVDISFDRGKIAILIEGEVFDELNLLNTLLRRIPAHLALGITVHIRKSYRYDFPVRRAGYLQTGARSEPISEDRANALSVPVSRTTLSRPRFTSQPTAKMRSNSMEVPVAHGGLDRPRLAGNFPDSKKVHTGRPGTSGGAIYCTRIKPKRID